ncbi:MAG: hypothetical protein IT536_16820 [Hyphomicrobiales bacterium]|nr:hypothetical protein [Hyphomicrobiales bacterium]
MMQTDWIRPATTAAMLALAVLAAPATARAQDDSVERGNVLTDFEQRVWGTIVRGLGLRDPNAPDIDYRERSPLVVPPSRDLPAPQARTIPRDPAWPVDPDVTRARKQTEAKRRSNAATALENQGRPISPEELNRGRAAADNSGRSNAPAPGSDPDGGAVPPSELGYLGGLFSGRAFGFSGYRAETGTFTQEPPRSTLTAPPPGYQTPSPDQPYGVSRRIERTPVAPYDPAGRGM